MGISTVGVVGAGTMGGGIAQACALGGYDVLLYDVAPDFVERGLERIGKQLAEGVARKKVEARAADDAIRRITRAHTLADVAAAELVIEAAPEQLELKRQLWSELDALMPAHTLFASNTSSLSINALAGATQQSGPLSRTAFF